MTIVAILNYVGLAVSFVYLYFEFKQKSAMWIFSMLCSMIYGYIYFSKQLYADMGFSCFNIGMCIWGLIQWQKRLKGSSPASRPETTDEADSHMHDEQQKATHVIEYRHFSRREWVEVAGVSFVVFAVIFGLLHYLTDSPVPARDAFNTTINIVGTWVLGRRVIEVWGFWFVANVFSVYLYYIRSVEGDMIPTICLYLFYTGASVYGYLKWKRKGVCVQ